MREQDENLARVSTKIAPIVLRFCRKRWHRGEPEFHMEELLRFVKLRTEIAPDSPSRILRQLRLKKRIDYIVVSRSESLYKLTAVKFKKHAR